MSRITIEVDGSTVENTLASVLKGEIADVKGELAKTDDAAKRLRGRLAFLEALERECATHHVELHTPEPGTVNGVSPKGAA